MNSINYIPEELQGYDLYVYITSLLDYLTEYTYDDEINSIAGLYDINHPNHDPEYLLNFLGAGDFLSYDLTDDQKKTISYLVSNLNELKGTIKGESVLLRLIGFDSKMYEWFWINEQAGIPERMENSGFDIDPALTGGAWTLETSWAYDSTNGWVTKTAGDVNELYQADADMSINLVDTEEYWLNWYVNITAGTLTPYLGTTAGDTISVTGVNRQRILYTAGTGIEPVRFVPSADFEGYVDNVSVKALEGSSLTWPEEFPGCSVALELTVAFRTPITDDLETKYRNLAQSLLWLCVVLHEIRWIYPIQDEQIVTDTVYFDKVNEIEDPYDFSNYDHTYETCPEFLDAFPSGLIYKQVGPNVNSDQDWVIGSPTEMAIDGFVIGATSIIGSFAGFTDPETLIIGQPSVSYTQYLQIQDIIADYPYCAVLLDSDLIEPEIISISKVVEWTEDVSPIEEVSYLLPMEFVDTEVATSTFEYPILVELEDDVDAMMDKVFEQEIFTDEILDSIGVNYPTVGYGNIGDFNITGGQITITSQVVAYVDDFLHINIGDAQIGGNELADFSPPISGIEVWYSMDDQSAAQATDTSSYDKHGTHSGTPVYGTNAYHRYLELDYSVPDYITLLQANNPAITTGGTISFWMYAQSLGENSVGTVYECRTDATNGIRVYISGTNTITLWINNTLTVSTTSAFSLSTWHHVSVAYDDVAKAIYVDGVDVTDTGGSSIQLPPMTANSYFGRSQYSGDYGFDGYLDDIRIYRRSLFDSELKEIALHIVSHEYNCKAWYQFTNQLEDMAQDFSGNDNHAITTGSWDFVNFGPSRNDGFFTYKLPGDGDHLLVASPSADLKMLSGGTISMWVKIDAASADDKIIMFSTGGAFSWYLDINYTTGYSLRFVTDGPNTTESNLNSVSLATWHHVAITFDNTGRVVYVDGVDETDSGGGLADLPQDIAGSMYLGISPLASQNFEGSYADVRIYDRILSQAEIANLISLRSDFYSEFGQYDEPGTLTMTSLGFAYRLQETL